MHRIVRPEQHFIPRPPIVAQRNFTIRTPIHIVKNGQRNPLPGKQAKVFNIDDAL
jgi:hypothetical protein